MSTPSWAALFRGPHLVHTIILSLGVAVHAIDVFIISTVMPSVVAEIGGSAFYTWSTMLYVVASIIGTACGGFVKAALGTRRGYSTGALIFLVGSVGCAMAPSMAILLAARTAQGLGGGLLAALSYSMIGALYVESLRPRVLSAISGVWGIAALAGPMVGGIFAELGWWRGAFWASVPVIVLLMGLAWRALSTETSTGAATQRLPLSRLLWLGTGVLSVALSGHVTAVWMRLGLIGLACLLVGLTFRLDRHAVTRLFPSQPLSWSSPVGTAYWMFFLFGVTSSQVSVFMPLVVQVLHGVSPLGAGYFAAIRSITWTLAALASAGFSARYVHVMIPLGPLVLTVGVAGQAVWIVDGPLWLLGLCAAISGVGIGLCFAHLASWTISAARPGEEDLTSSSIPTSQSLGIAFGAALAGLIANAAGLASGVSTSAVAAAATWVYAMGVLAPAAITALAWRLLRLHWKNAALMASRTPRD
jgi:MFS family permease